MIKIYDGRTEFYQWDLNRKIIVSDPTVTEAHFCNKTGDCSLVVEVKDGLADVPNILLQTDWPINVYLYCGDCYTKEHTVFKVKPRTKPTDYIYTETELRTVKEYVKEYYDEAVDTAKAYTDNAFIEHGINKQYEGLDISTNGDSTVRLKAGNGFIGVTDKNSETTISGKADVIDIKSYSSGMTTRITADWENGFKVIRKHDEAGGYNTGFIVNGLPAAIKNNEIKQLATEEYVDNAIANIGGGSTPSGNITANSVVIGEGEATDLSIAGGTTNISDYGKKAGLNTIEIATLSGLLIANGGINKSVASAPLSIALGLSNESTKSGAITLGYGNKNAGFNSTAIGALNNITGDSAFAYGYKNAVYGDFGVALGQENIVGKEGDDSITDGFAGGILSQATGKGAFAFGNECKALAEYSIALGGDCTVEEAGVRGIAVGNNCTVKGKYGFACGSWTEAKRYAFACGDTTHATGDNSFAEGWNTYATKESAHAQGTDTQANHKNSHAGGLGTKTGRDSQMVIGQYNGENTDAYFVVGNGTDDGHRSNAFSVCDDGSYVLGKKIATEEYVTSAIAEAIAKLKAEL